MQHNLDGHMQVCRESHNGKPLVSVICMTYNQAPYIRDALDGIISQEADFSFEVLVHDDASEDGTSGIVAQYARQYPNLISPILQRENQYSKGVDTVRTVVLPQSRGKYIAYCEGDDFWTASNKLQSQVDFLASHGSYSACVHNSIKLDLSRNQTSVMFGTDDKDYEIEDIIKKGGGCWQTSSLVCKREVCEDYPAFLLKAAGFGDYQLSINAVLKGKIHYYGTPMSMYRFLTKGSWSERCRQNPQMLANSYEQMVDLLKDLNNYTGYAYSDCIKYCITLNQFKADEARMQYRELLAPKYRSVLLSLPKKSRFAIWIKALLGPKCVRYLANRHSTML